MAKHKETVSFGKIIDLTGLASAVDCNSTKLNWTYDSHTNNEIVYNTKASMKSLGEKVYLKLNVSDNKSVISIESKTSQLLDWGKSKSNVELFVSCLNEYVNNENNKTTDNYVSYLEGKKEFLRLSQDETVFKNVRYMGGLPNLEPGPVAFVATSDGLALFDQNTLEKKAVIDWAKMIKIEVESGKLSDSVQSPLTGFAAKQGIGFMSGFAGGLLQKNPLTVFLKQNDEDSFLHEILFDDRRNVKIKNHIMLSRAKYYSDSKDQNKSAPATNAMNQSPDITDQIKKLAELKESGILTEEEFVSKKKELLDRL